MGVPRSLMVFLVAVLGLVAPGRASAVVADCSAGDAPDAYDNTTTCQSVCTESGNELICALETLCPATNPIYNGSEAKAVTNFTASHDVSIWGSCLGGGPKFCCVFDEGATNVSVIELQGTDDPDEVL